MMTNKKPPLGEAFSLGEAGLYLNGFLHPISC